MPLYEYRCSKCGRTFEKIQSFSHKPREKCPECGGKAERLLSAPAIHFKGTGWYITDYARKGKSDEGRKRDPAGSESKGSESKGGDKKDAGGKDGAAKKAKKKP